MVTTGHCIPDNIIVDKVILVIVNSQTYKQAYTELKAFQVHDFATVQMHFRQPEFIRKQCQDTAVDHGFGILAEEAA